MTRPMGTPTRIVVDSSAPPLAMEFAPGGAAVYLRLSEHEAVRTAQVAEQVLADYDAQDALVGFEFLNLESPAFPARLEQVKTRFRGAAPALDSVEAVSA